MEAGCGYAKPGESNDGEPWLARGISQSRCRVETDRRTETDRSAGNEYGQEHHAATRCGNVRRNRQRSSGLDREKSGPHPLGSLQGLVAAGRLPGAIRRGRNSVEEVVRGGGKQGRRRVLPDRTGREPLSRDGDGGAVFEGVSEDEGNLGKLSDWAIESLSDFAVWAAFRNLDS